MFAKLGMVSAISLLYASSAMADLSGAKGTLNNIDSAVNDAVTKATLNNIDSAVNDAVTNVVRQVF